MPVTRKVAHTRPQRRQHLQRQRQQPSPPPPSPQPTAEEQSRAIPMDIETNKPLVQQTTGPTTRAHANRQAIQQTASKAANPKAGQNQKAPLIAVDQEQNSAALHKDIEEILESDLYCAICREVYVNPLILNCSHSFCKFCLTNWLSKQVGCPSCRNVAVFQTENLALRNVISKMIQTSSAQYKKDRAAMVKSRMEAEDQQQKDGVAPIMEKKEAELDNDVGYRVRNSRRRRRVIGQWKGSNGATIWRTNIVGANEVVRMNPEDSSGESADDNYVYVDYAHSEPDTITDSEIADEARGNDEERDDEANRFDYRSSIFRLYDDNLPDISSDSNDSEFVAEAEDESDDDDHMSDTEEAIEEDSEDWTTTEDEDNNRGQVWSPRVVLRHYPLDEDINQYRMTAASFNYGVFERAGGIMRVQGRFIDLASDDESSVTSDSSDDTEDEPNENENEDEDVSIEIEDDDDEDLEFSEEGNDDDEAEDDDDEDDDDDDDGDDDDDDDDYDYDTDIQYSL